MVLSYPWQAQEAEARGDTILMEKKRRTALYLNIIGIVVGVVTWVIFMISIIVRVSVVKNEANDNYYE